MSKKILVAYGVDVDAVAGWLGSYGGEDSPDDISRGMFAGEVGTPRLLDLFDRYKLKTTWFIPGHSIETFPTQMQDVKLKNILEKWASIKTKNLNQQLKNNPLQIYLKPNKG